MQLKDGSTTGKIEASHKYETTTKGGGTMSVEAKGEVTGNSKGTTEAEAVVTFKYSK